MPEVVASETLPASTPIPELSAQPLTFRERIGDAITGYQDWAEVHPYAATTVETVVLFAAKKAVRTVGEKLGINFGNGHNERQLQFAADHPVLAAAHSVIAAPVFEETMFRGVVPKLIKGKLGIEENTKAAKIADQVAVLGFAATHIGDPRTKAGRDNLAVPLSPLIGGEQYSSLRRRRGIKHAIVAHMVHNALATAEVAPKVMKLRRSR